MKNRIIKKIMRIILLTFVGFAVLGTFYFLWKKSQPKVVRYEIVQPTKGNIEVKSIATGKVEPRFEILIKPQISGIIDELKKEAGQMVKKDEIIATIKVIPEMVQLNSAESRVRVAQISINEIYEVYKRDKDLFEQGVISKEDYQKSKASYLKAKEEKDNAQSALELIRDGIAKSSKMASTTQVRSTISGMILDIPVKVGNQVIMSNNFNEGTTIASVADMNDMIFRGYVDETEIGNIHENMPVKLVIGAISNRTFNAKLEYVSPKSVENNGVIQFEVKAAIQLTGDDFIRAGYSANAEFVLDKKENVMTIPEGCVEFKGDSSFVQLLKEETPVQTFKRKSVDIGLSDGVKVEIVKGLTYKNKIRGALINDEN